MESQSIRVESWRGSASRSEWVLMETWINTLLHGVLIFTNEMDILDFEGRQYTLIIISPYFKELCHNSISKDIKLLFDH